MVTGTEEAEGVANMLGVEEGMTDSRTRARAEGGKRYSERKTGRQSQTNGKKERSFIGEVMTDTKKNWSASLLFQSFSERRF